MDTPTKLAEAAGISIPFASQLLSGKKTPSLRKAIAIYRKTGLKFGPIEGLPRASIEMMAANEAARARAQEAA